MFTVSVVIPVYNGASSIETVVRLLISVFKKARVNVEIMLVNDGSVDASDTVCKRITRQLSGVTYIALSKNYGQHNALLTGIRLTKGDYVICMDDDLETPPEESLKLLTTIRTLPYDVVYGQYTRGGKFRRFGSSINNLMASIVFRKPKDVQLNSFFIMTRFVANHISSYSGPFVYLPGLIFQVTNRVGGIALKHNGRHQRFSRYQFRTLLALWLSGFTNYSLVPLRLSTALGFLSSVMGFILAVVVIVARLIDNEVYLGWSSLIVTQLIFGGLILMCMGILGEYIGRIFITVNKGPQSIIRETQHSSKYVSR